MAKLTHLEVFGHFFYFHFGFLSHCTASHTSGRSSTVNKFDLEFFCFLFCSNNVPFKLIHPLMPAVKNKKQNHKRKLELFFKGGHDLTCTGNPFRNRRTSPFRKCNCSELSWKFLCVLFMIFVNNKSYGFKYFYLKWKIIPFSEGAMHCYIDQCYIQ